MIPRQVKHGRTISKLCFGTVQLGIPYGIANATGMPDAAQAVRLLTAAYAQGVTLFDTARAYGTAESLLGSALSKGGMADATIITKLSPLDGLSEAEPETSLCDKVTDSVSLSLHSLRLASLPYVLLHRAHHLQAHGGKIWRQLLRLRQQGLIEKLGVSVATPEEAHEALRMAEIECVELPFNMLDWRWESAGIPTLLAARPDVLVLARSALLQGLLAQKAEIWPVIPKEDAHNIVTMMENFASRFERKNRVDLCLAYARAQPWIDSVIVGMETMEQVQENLQMFALPALDSAACGDIRRQFSHTDATLLNPALWPRNPA
jgi:spore coat polysaccharide biosynthesis protein SpsF